jgi:acetyl esterase/lipase
MDVYLSREQNKDAPILNDVSMGLFQRKLVLFLTRGMLTLTGLYKPDPTSPIRSPLVFESHRDLPPTYIQACGIDPLRDDALIYERILSEDSGVLTKLDIYPGLPHGFWSVWTGASFSKAHQQDSLNALGWLLEQIR